MSSCFFCYETCDFHDKGYGHVYQLDSILGVWLLRLSDTTYPCLLSTLRKLTQKPREPLPWHRWNVKPGKSQSMDLRTLTSAPLWHHEFQANSVLYSLRQSLDLLAASSLSLERLVTWAACVVSSVSISWTRFWVEGPSASSKTCLEYKSGV